MLRYRLQLCLAATGCTLGGELGGLLAAARDTGNPPESIYQLKGVLDAVQ